MGLVTIALVIVAVWVGVLVSVLAMCKASGRADAEEERYLAEECEDVSAATAAAAVIASRRPALELREGWWRTLPHSRPR